MAVAKHGPWMTAATEHSPEVPLLQSMGMAANVVQESATEQIWQEETRQQGRSPQTKDGSATQQRAASSSG